MKKFLAILLSLIIIIGATACSKTKKTGVTVNIGVLKGPTGMSAAWLMDQNDQKLSANDYNFTVAGTPDAITGQLINGDMDIAALPTNAISALYNKTEGKISVLGVNALGVLYILENGNSINSVSDLAGKTVLASGKGSTAEYVLNYILEKNGVIAEIVWAAEHSEAATLALKGDYDIVMLPEPFVTNVTAKSDAFRVALDLTEEWEALGSGELTMGGIAVRTAFLEEHPDAVKAFVDEYGKSVAFTNSQPEDAAKLIAKYEIAAEEVAKNAIPRCNIVWLHGKDYKAVLENFLGVVYNANPAGIGGKMPGDDFYLDY
ncbi:MAG: ABC transporter substrate-binding protein [Oscillospiraceae bacterium]|nr:ABC transporter substrate-binding protein [Oscillospiraceae bacterium]